MNRTASVRRIPRAWLLAHDGEFATAGIDVCVESGLDAPRARFRLLRIVEESRNDARRLINVTVAGANELCNLNVHDTPLGLNDCLSPSRNGMQPTALRKCY